MFVPGGNRFMNAGQELGLCQHDAVVMRSIFADRDVGRNVGNKLFEQVFQPVADMFANLGFAQWRQIVQAANMVRAGGDRRKTVGQGAVEIEQDRLHRHGNLAEGCPLGSIQAMVLRSLPTPTPKEPMIVTSESTDPPASDASPTPEYVFREYAPRIYNIAKRLLSNEADAEDVTQDVLLQVIRKLDTFRGDSALPTWLHRVTVNAALAHREKRANRQKRETSAGNEDILDAASVDAPTHVKLPRPNAEATPDQIALAGEQRAIIENAIAQLPEGFREVYVLADVEQLPNAEIGEMLDLSVPAVKSRLHRARLRMRDLLMPHFEEITR